jgi:hypothetical protein
MDDDRRRLEQRARDALAREWSEMRWHYWVRVSWHHGVTEATANDHVDRLIHDLHRTGSPTIRVVAGFHGDDPANPHAHVLVHLSRRLRARIVNTTEFTEWFQPYWYHGQCWAEPFDADRREHGGAIEYLARNPGTVIWG